MSRLTAEAFAKMIDGCSYGKELTKEQRQLAKENGLVVVYGASDDLMEFDGAICDEMDCYGGGTTFLNREGLLKSPDCGCEECEYFKNYVRQNYRSITSFWCREDGYAWTYETEIPHATFEIWDEGERYCRGLVFSVDDLKQGLAQPFNRIAALKGAGFLG